MYTHTDTKFKKSINYMDPVTKVSRRECIAFAVVINKPRVVREFFDDWVLELGDKEDNTNLDAIATWVSKQKDILTKYKKSERVLRLRSRFLKTMYTWKNHYLDNGFEFVNSRNSS